MLIPKWKGHSRPFIRKFFFNSFRFLLSWPSSSSSPVKRWENLSNLFIFFFVWMNIIITNRSSFFTIQLVKYANFWFRTIARAMHNKMTEHEKSNRFPTYRNIIGIYGILSIVLIIIIWHLTFYCLSTTHFWPMPSSHCYHTILLLLLLLLLNDPRHTRKPFANAK